LGVKGPNETSAQRVYHFVVSGFGTVLIGPSGLGFINAFVFPTFIAK
jgi:hypothetical protein